MTREEREAINLLMGLTGVSKADLTGERLDANATRVRDAVAWILWADGRRTDGQVAVYLNRHHSSINTAIGRHAQRLANLEAAIVQCYGPKGPRPQDDVTW